MQTRGAGSAQSADWATTAEESRVCQPPLKQLEMKKQLERLQSVASVPTPHGTTGVKLGVGTTGVKLRTAKALHPT